MIGNALTALAVCAIVAFSFGLKDALTGRRAQPRKPRGQATR